MVDVDNGDLSLNPMTSLRRISDEAALCSIKSFRSTQFARRRSGRLLISAVPCRVMLFAILLIVLQ